MKKFNEVELELINIQIGCILRLARLRKGLSQHSLSLLVDFNPTLIGRIERSENKAGWEKLLLISQQLEVNFCDLFSLKNKTKLLSIVTESFRLEDKLTVEKENYYTSLQTTIISKYQALQQ